MFPTTAHATVERPPGHRAMPRIQPFKRNADPDPDPDFTVNSCLTLSSAFRGTYAGNANTLDFETLYRCAYNVVYVGHGEVLYTLVATTMAAEVEKLAGSLDHAASALDAEFLRQLLTSWKKHSKATDMIRDIVMYMDRDFVPKRGKTPVRDLGLRAWRDGMLRRSAGDVRPRLRDAMLEVARRERAGGAVDVAFRELMAGATKMLVDVGEGLYEEVFETPFLDETCVFYVGESTRLLARPCGCGEYLRAVESMVDAEKVRVSGFLHARTEEKVAAVMLTEMVEKNVARVIGMEGCGLAFMLADGRYWDLTRMHRLLGRVQGGVPVMRDGMVAHFLEIRNAAGNDERLLAASCLQPGGVLE